MKINWANMNLSSRGYTMITSLLSNWIIVRPRQIIRKSRMKLNQSSFNYSQLYKPLLIYWRKMLGWRQRARIQLKSNKSSIRLIKGRFIFLSRIKIFLKMQLNNLFRRIKSMKLIIITIKILSIKLYQLTTIIIRADLYISKLIILRTSVFTRKKKKLININLKLQYF
jgi:hypothetical protein